MQTSAEEARKGMVIGSGEQCLDKIQRYIEAGITHFIFLVTPFNVEDEFQRFAEDIIPKFKSAR